MWFKADEHFTQQKNDRERLKSLDMEEVRVNEGKQSHETATSSRASRDGSP
jgi:hypothetical protein